ncbi:hypothetical protein L4C37_06645 [Vibrio kagoshimensis]|uniref:YncE family protein n=1 Tax=Vibrio kagoshimensis TaxID=2910244 RepID=UPI003D21663B
MHFAPGFFGKRTLLTLSIAAFISGCSDGENKADTGTQDSQPDHQEENVSRVVISEAGSNNVYVLNANSFETLGQFALLNAPSGLKTSPDGRYALALQRSQDTVEIIDSGVYAETHGDHFHLHADEPVLLSDTYTSPAPTHYDLADHKTALFFDGNAEAGLNAELKILDDATIAGASQIASYSFTYAMHSTAQIFGEHVFTGIKSDPAVDGLPDQVAALELHGDHFHGPTVANVTCPSLHGSAQSETQVAFACDDGVVVISDPGVTPQYTKIVNPTSLEAGSRFGKVLGFKNSDKLLFVSRSLQAFQLNQGALEEISWKETNEEGYLTYASTESAFLVLSSTGKLKVFDPSTSFTQSAEVQLWETVPTLAEGQKFSISYDKRSHHVYVTDPTNKVILEVELHEQPTVKTHQLSFVPGLITWAGTTKEEHHH